MKAEKKNDREVFLHHRLDAYRVSCEMAVAARHLLNSLPPGYGKLRDQLRRASVAVPLLIAEGANRRSRKQKRQRFEEALGETGECAAAAEIALILEVGEAEAAEKIIDLAKRVGGMLFALERKHR